MDIQPAVPHRSLTPVWIGIGLAIIAGAGLAYGMLGQNKVRESAQRDVGYTQPTPSESDAESTTTSPGSSSSSSTNFVSWDFTGTEYRAMGQAPGCPDPLVLEPVVDLTNVTGILYPGQTRGGNYKPHGGFRFDNATSNAVSVKAPIDAFLVDGARFIAEGSLQYTFDFINSCGIKYRVGHLLELTPQFQAFAEAFPAAVEGDSRTTTINPPVFVAKGTEIATAIGIAKGPNVFVDWGVYDLRTKNDASKDAAWVAKRGDDKSLAPYAVCWFDLLSTANHDRVHALPAADPESGKSSDYCE
jgi:hypothetical protein